MISEFIIISWVYKAQGKPVNQNTFENVFLPLFVAFILTQK